MHNKSWIADNRLALVGGRNLGDEYFGASDEVNFVDLDFAMVGPVVRDVSASFDRYWNSPLAYPVDGARPRCGRCRNAWRSCAACSQAALGASRRRRRYAAALREPTKRSRACSPATCRLQWTAELRAS